jgi:cell division septation protein DedD
MVLGGRHLVGLFVLLVVVMGVVFTLGYLLGRSRYEDQARAVAATPVAGSAPALAAGTTSSDAGSAPAGRGEAQPSWDFYHSGEPAKTAELKPAPAAAPVLPAQPQPKPAVPPARAVDSAPAKSPAPAPKVAASVPAAPATAPAGSALIPKGAVTLQVAALLHEADALALAQALQEKKFPAIVTTPSTDKYYRVQVGPYADAKSAAFARKELEKQGFKSIVRR